MELVLSFHLDMGSGIGVRLSYCGKCFLASSSTYSEWVGPFFFTFLDLLLILSCARVYLRVGVHT